jgi:hypothetical protein
MVILKMLSIDLSGTKARYACVKDWLLLSNYLTDTPIVIITSRTIQGRSTKR